MAIAGDIRLIVQTSSGRAYDLTNEAESLQYSNVRRGGDEQATFTLRRSWLSSNPEIKRGATVHIVEDLETTWRGRLEEIDRSTDEAETMEISCYGTGVRLRDGLLRMIFVDRSFEQFQDAGRTRRATFINAGYTFHPWGPTTDTLNGLSALEMSIEGAWAVGYLPIVEAWYDAGPDAEIASIYYEHIGGPGSGVGFTLNIGSYDDDFGASGTLSGDVIATVPGLGTFTPNDPRRYVMFQFACTITGAGADGFTRPIFLTKVALYGTHGLVPQGPSPGGFTAGQIFGYLVSQASGVQARRIDSGSYIIPHFVLDTQTTEEEGIEAANEYEGMEWGTYGPADVLERGRDGYFDAKAYDPNPTGDWIIRREETEDIDLHDELGSLYDVVKVNWQDSAGGIYTETRTAVIPALANADPPISRTAELDIGLGTQAIAQQAADLFFGLQGLDPPSRGSIELVADVTRRGGARVKPTRMRADGATILIPNALPDSQAVSLSHVDRRSVFPIQRVSVDASGEQPAVSVDLDQVSDRMTVLQAQLQGGQDSYGGGIGSGGEAGTSAASPVSGAGKAKKKKKKKDKARRKRPAKRGK